MRQKTELRRSLLAEIAAADPDTLAAASRRIAQQLTATSEWRNAELVLAYRSMRGEPDTAPLLQAALAEGKLVALPRIVGSFLQYHQYTGKSTSFSRHPFGMEEPTASSPVIDTARAEPGKRILVIVPGLAFDAQGGRLGRGKGYYDRFLAARSSHLTAAGICFDLQLRPLLPMEAHDARVELVVTESLVIRTHAGPSV
ncbi:MAG TPA: 5-formyltetrahydrofolate cyclo-ligase [Spirochaetia bacterium]|nr:5-formyltetrahydrofolate cyclo-ligase [Spirochaetia bacterium]